jgi:hypothetical protein
VPQGSARHFPPSPLLAIWIPLLESIAANHAHFPSVLTSHIITRLLADADADPVDERDDATTMTAAATATEKASYDHCLSAWGAWLIEWCRADESDADVSTRRQDVFFQLVQALASSSQGSGTSSSPSSQQQSGYVPPSFIVQKPKKNCMGKTDEQTDPLSPSPPSSR